MSIVNKKQGYLKGAVIIAAGGFLSKLLGAIYRIPLTNILGSKGMGIYQMVYPLYCILLTVSASGIPTGVARLVSSGKVGVEKDAFRLYGVVGLLASVAMALLAVPLSKLLSEVAVAGCARALAPSVFFVAILSVVRGYFQGKGNMLPTAITEVCEQLIKVGAGVILAYVYRADLNAAVASTLFAVTLSEAFACALSVGFYRSRPKETKPLYAEKRQGFKVILAYTIPLTLTAMAVPLSQLLESVVFTRILRALGEDATSLWGIFSGCAVTIVNLPVSVTYGLAAASIPQISPLAEKGECRKAQNKALRCLGITLIVSLPASVALYFLAPYAAKLLFGSLGEEGLSLLVLLVKVMAVNAVTSSLVQTSSACLTALGKPKMSAVSQWTACILRVMLTAALLGIFHLSALGAAIAANCSFLVAFILNFCYIIKERNKGQRGRQS